ncbi:MAG: sporulation protein [Saprospiraceae bacterium]
MFGKVKLFFGIEGLKVDLEIQETFTLNDSSIIGSVRLHSKTAQRLKKLQIVLKETYQRGRSSEKRTNDYILGSIELNEDVLISANGEKIIDFNLPFKFQHSSIEKLGQKSSVHHQISRMAKWINNAKSEFAVEVATQVEGTALNPSVRKEIKLMK